MCSFEFLVVSKGSCVVVIGVRCVLVVSCVRVVFGFSVVSLFSGVVMCISKVVGSSCVDLVSVIVV